MSDEDRLFRQPTMAEIQAQSAHNAGVNDLTPHDAALYVDYLGDDLTRARALLESARRHAGNDRASRIVFAKWRILYLEEALAFFQGTAEENKRSAS